MIVTIRNAKIGDEVGIGSVHAQSWKETYAGLMPQDYLDAITPEQRSPFWKEDLQIPEKRDYIWVAENAEREIVGFCCGGKARLPELGFDSELYAIYLLKKYQGKKIGRKLFEALTDKLKSEENKSMYLWVVKDSATCRIYESLGGEITSLVDVDNIGGQDVEEVAYSFRL